MLQLPVEGRLAFHGYIIEKQIDCVQSLRYVESGYSPAFLFRNHLDLAVLRLKQELVQAPEQPIVINYTLDRVCRWETALISFTDHGRHFYSLAKYNKSGMCMFVGKRAPTVQDLQKARIVAMVNQAYCDHNSCNSYSNQYVLSPVMNDQK